MSTYYGRRTRERREGVIVEVREDPGPNDRINLGRVHELDPRVDFMRLGDGSFGWGSPGPGANQLAFAILAHALRPLGRDRYHLGDFHYTDAIANTLTLKFARDIIAAFDAVAWELEGAAVRDWVDRNLDPLPAPECGACGKPHL